MLRQQGWPEDAIKQLAAIFLEAGFNRCIEAQKAKRDQDEALIQKAVAN